MLRLLLLVATVFTLASGIIIDQSLPDGIYSAQPDPSDAEQHHLVRRENIQDLPGCGGREKCRNMDADNVALPPKDKGNLLTERLPIGNGNPRCSDQANRTYTTEEYHGAINRLFETPLFWAPPNHAVLAVQGRAVAYMCNFGRWNSVSLVEYMAAMAELDLECRENHTGDRPMPDWNKQYGRATIGHTICAWDGYSGKTLLSELPWVHLKGCKTYKSGISRMMGKKGECNDNASGDSVWDFMKTMYPWYKKNWKNVSNEEKEEGED